MIVRHSTAPWPMPRQLAPIAGLIASVAITITGFAYGLAAIERFSTADPLLTISVKGTFGPDRSADYAGAPGQRFAAQRAAGG
jgi:hypothetical protein